MDELSLKLNAMECKMLLGMIEWAWTEGGIRSEQQAMIVLTVKGKLLGEMKEKQSGKHGVGPEEEKIVAVV